MTFVTDLSGALHEKHKFRTDVGATYIYSGWADPGTATSAAFWSIQRETIATGFVDYAAGGAFSQVWDDRAGLTYA